MANNNIEIMHVFFVEYFNKECKKFILHVTMFVLYYDLLQVFIEMKAYQRYNN